MSSSASERMRERGLKVTASRLAVLQAVQELGGHPDAAAVAIHARAHLGAISTQAVYDGLAALSTAGLLRRIEPAGSPARYETRVGDNHHHLICRICGRTEDVDCEVGAAPCLHVGDDLGFDVDEAEIVFWGVCPECRGAA